MERFKITDTAGPYVAGLANPGSGEILLLTAAQAEYELRLGSLVRDVVPEVSALKTSKPKE